MKRTNRLWVLAIVLGLFLALPAAASAQETDTSSTVGTDRSIESVKARAQDAVDRRLDTLANLERRILDHEYMTTVHKATLTADIADAIAGLIALNRDIQNAGTAAELRELVPLIATDYRVYLVIVPKSYEVGASDRVAHVVSRFEETADTLADAIDRAEEAGYDMTQANRWLISARDEIAEARRTGVPVAGDVIDLDALDWEQPAKSALDEGHRRLKNARIDLRQAKGSLDKARQAIEEAIGG
ncbi:MAG: hypothetical protein BMS9Abin12_1744 [Acidimicrobiia bacterium]|nr:MAG: hypothetical protein BMS9Abin12_1744 [Acidimicrobiia bacterium]